jgi:bifunctional ADP-heptose synthase (sugar kinase/adenylyltransferase)
MSYFLNAAAFLIQTIFSFAIGLFLVRVLLLAAGASFYEAALLANYAGGIVVMKRGTATVSADELRDAIRKDHAVTADSDQ